MKSCSNCSKISICFVRKAITYFVEDNWLVVTNINRHKRSSDTFDEWYNLLGERCSQYEHEKHFSKKK